MKSVYAFGAGWNLAFVTLTHSTFVLTASTIAAVGFIVAWVLTDHEKKASKA